MITPVTEIALRLALTTGRSKSEIMILVLDFVWKPQRVALARLGGLSRRGAGGGAAGGGGCSTAGGCEGCSGGAAAGDVTGTAVATLGTDGKATAAPGAAA